MAYEPMSLEQISGMGSPAIRIQKISELLLDRHKDLLGLRRDLEYAKKQVQIYTQSLEAMQVEVNTICEVLVEQIGIVQADLIDPATTDKIRRIKQDATEPTTTGH